MTARPPLNETDILDIIDAVKASVPLSDDEEARVAGCLRAALLSRPDAGLCRADAALLDLLTACKGRIVSREHAIEALGTTEDGYRKRVMRIRRAGHPLRSRYGVGYGVAG